MMSAKNKYLISVSGPTAVGKTELCINLAKKFYTDIISSDSRQFFHEISLGTAKPSNEDLATIKHHFINNLSIHDAYDVNQFEKDSMTLMEQLFQEKEVLIMTGGSGLYLDAIYNGLDQIPSIDPEIRNQVIDEYQQKGLDFLQEEIKNIDPKYYSKVDLNNPQRLMRAIEVYRGTGKPFSSFHQKSKAQRPFQIIKIGLERPREELYERINLRMDQMIAKGLFEEAEKFYPWRNLNALQTVGYTEIFGYLDGKYDKEEAIRLLKRNSRRYAKRQLTWFKKDLEIHWFHPENQAEILKFILLQMA
jgi:tRNA dimethylallyltransferase